MPMFPSYIHQVYSPKRLVKIYATLDGNIPERASRLVSAAHARVRCGELRALWCLFDEREAGAVPLEHLTAVGKVVIRTHVQGQVWGERQDSQLWDHIRAASASNGVVYEADFVSTADMLFPAESSQFAAVVAAYSRAAGC